MEVSTRKVLVSFLYDTVFEGVKVSQKQPCDAYMRDTTSNNAHTVCIQGILNLAPSKTWSQAYHRAIRADAELVHPLQIDKDTSVIDTGPAGIWRVAAAPDREFCFEIADNVERLGHLCSPLWK